MNEVKNPKRPMYFYYGIVLIVLLLLNMFLCHRSTIDKFRKWTMAHSCR